MIIQDNEKIDVSHDINKNEKINLIKPKKTKTKIKLNSVNKNVKNNNNHRTHIINLNNKQAIYEVTSSKTHFSILWTGARLLSINQIFSILQIKKRQYELFSYKKTWHHIIKNILIEHSVENTLPFFTKNVEITVFRQAPRLVDNDAIEIMFKFIIDALKRTKDNPLGIIAEDNPKIVTKIIPKSEKGNHYVGIKIALCNEDVHKFLPKQILNHSEECSKESNFSSSRN